MSLFPLFAPVDYIGPDHEPFSNVAVLFAAPNTDRISAFTTDEFEALRSDAPATYAAIRTRLERLVEAVQAQGLERRGGRIEDDLLVEAPHVLGAFDDANARDVILRALRRRQRALVTA